MVRLLLATPLALLLVLPTSASAQPASAFASLVDTVAPGTPVSVKAHGGKTTRGRVVELTADRLVLATGFGGETRVVFDEPAVAEIRRRDSLASGIALGVLSGIIATYTSVKTVCSPNDPECEVNAFVVLAAPIIGAGAVTGGLIDHAVRKTLFRAPTRGARMSIAPLVGYRAAGALVSVGF